MKKFMNRVLKTIYLATLFLVIQVRAEFQPDMKLTGFKSTVIKGDLTQKGKEGLFAIYAYNLEIQQPTDAATGQATGKRTFKPVSVIVPAGPLNTPALHQLLASNKGLNTVEIRFWAAGNTGADAVYLTVRLTNAKVVTLRDWVANIRDPEFPQQHQVEFSFEKIEWITTGPAGGTVSDGPTL